MRHGGSRVIPREKVGSLGSAVCPRFEQNGTLASLSRVECRADAHRSRCDGLDHARVILRLGLSRAPRMSASRYCLSREPRHSDGGHSIELGTIMGIGSESRAARSARDPHFEPGLKERQDLGTSCFLPDEAIESVHKLYALRPLTHEATGEVVLQPGYVELQRSHPEEVGRCSIPRHRAGRGELHE